jgi:aspartate racemase
MSAIGILGGMGPQASARLVELLIEQTSLFVDSPKDSDFPEIIHLSVPVPNFISNKSNMQKAKTILIERTRLLEAAGSTMNCIACNTAHLLLPELQAVTMVPFVSIPKLVAEEVQLRGSKRVGLLATPTTQSSALYDEVLNGVAHIVRPSDIITQQTEEYIIKQLSNKLSDQERQDFRSLVGKFLHDNDLDAVILGCTELPLVYGQISDQRVISTLDVLSKALLKRYFA